MNCGFWLTSFCDKFKFVSRGQPPPLCVQTAWSTAAMPTSVMRLSRMFSVMRRGMFGMIFAKAQARPSPSARWLRSIFSASPSAPERMKRGSGRQPSGASSAQSTPRHGVDSVDADGRANGGHLTLQVRRHRALASGDVDHEGQVDQHRARALRIILVGVVCTGPEHHRGQLICVNRDVTALVCPGVDRLVQPLQRHAG